MAIRTHPHPSPPIRGDLLFFTLSPQHLRGPAAHLRDHALQFGHFLHHLLHLGKFVQHRVQFGHGDAAAFGDALAAASVQDVRIGTFLGSHSADHRFHLAHFLFLFAKVGAFKSLRAAGEHANNGFEWPELFHLAQLVEEIFQRELALAHLLFETLGFVDIHGFCGFFDETDDVTHAQDARGHAFGVERLEVFELFTHASKFDGLAGNGLHAQRCAAAGVAVEFGEYRAGDVESLIEMSCDVDSFLAGGRVEDKQSFLRFDEVAQADKFLEEWFVDLEAARGVEDERVAIIGFRELERATGDFLHIRLAFADEHRQLQLLTELFKLVHGCRPIDVGCDEQRSSALFMEETAEFGAGSGFAGTVQADHQDATGIAAELKSRVCGAEKIDEFVVDDFDDVLARLDAEKDFLADRLAFDALDKIASDFEIDVGFQQGKTDLAERIADVFLGDFAEAAQVLEGALELGA